jgi:hypothetical protein
MKPYGFRPGDGDKQCSKFRDRGTYGLPRGKHKQRKLHDERRLSHRQGRQDGKAQIRAELHEG